jgi:hypothetical protein
VETPDEETYHTDTMTPSIQIINGLRPKKPRDYSHMHANIVHHAITQYSLKRGLKKFNKFGEEAVSKELLQLHKTDTFTHQYVSKLIPDQKEGALESLMFFKEK